MFSATSAAFCKIWIGVNAIAGFTCRVNPNSPRPDPKVFLCELLFVLSGLCDEIGLRDLGLQKATKDQGKNCDSFRYNSIEVKRPMLALVFKWSQNRRHRNRRRCSNVTGLPLNLHFVQL